MDTLISQLESILFVSSKPVNLKQLAKLLAQDESAVMEAAKQLAEAKKNSGVVVLLAGENAQMASNGANAEVVHAFLNSDLREKLTDATVEVLGIIAYRGPISRSEIEAIRGVNSQYSVRHLLMRGLIEKTPGTDSRATSYQVTTEFLQHFGLTSVKDLPDFESLVSQIKLPEGTEDKASENSLKNDAPANPQIPQTQETPKPILLADNTEPELPAPPAQPELPPGPVLTQIPAAEN